MLLIYLSLSFIGIIIVSFGIIKNALIINITGYFIHISHRVFMYAHM